MTSRTPKGFLSGKRRFPALICAILLLAGCAESTEPQGMKEIHFDEVDSTFDAEVKASTDWMTAAENDHYRLLINGGTAEIGIEHKASGEIWYSNPQSRYTNGSAMGAAGERLSSQMDLEYMHNDTVQTYNTYSDAVLKNQYTFEKCDGGIRVNYLLGDKPEVYVVPQILSVERYEELRSQMTPENVELLETYYKLTTLEGQSSADEALLLDTYPILKERDAYIVQVSTNMFDPSKVFASDYLMNKLETLFASVGYTEEDWERDNEENLVTTAQEADLTVNVSIEYRLDGESFTVTVPRDSIYFDTEAIQLTNIKLLPRFGAADTTQTGYMFVPDGSGALIHLNNGKVNVGSFSKALYGRDKAVATEEQDTSAQTALYMPVFGMKVGDSAFLAIIEQGDAVAHIEADISGKLDVYNTVGAAFHVKSYSSVKTHGLSISVGNRYQQELVQSDLQIRYTFLRGEEADYTGMALQYQRYLLDNGLLSPQTMEGDIPLYIKTIGSVTAKKRVLGIPMDRPLSLTSFSQAVEILEELKSRGVHAIAMQMKAWCNNGLDNAAFNRLQHLSELGGGQGFEALVKYADENGVLLYPEANLMYASKSAKSKGFSKNRQASRTLENIVAYDYRYDLSTQGYDPATASYILSPAAYQDLLDGFLQDFQPYGLPCISLHNLGTDLNADYREDDVLDRQEAKDRVSQLIQELSGNGYQIAVDGANAYTLQGASLVHGVPMTSGNEYICDVSVPFYQIVLHGIVPYTSEALNMSADYETDVLRLAETGSIPAFEWIYESNQILKDTAYNYYSIHYGTWLEQAVGVYKDLNETLRDTRQATITDHTILSDGLTRTTYSNGYRVYVNYGTAATQADGIVMQPASYRVVSGGDAA